MSKELKAFETVKMEIIASKGEDFQLESDIELTKSLDIIETALKRIDYLERVNKDLQESKDKLIEERNNKIIEHRIVYDDYNFQSIKKFVACKGCQYYKNEKCSNTIGCFWKTLELQLKAFEIVSDKICVDFFLDINNEYIYVLRLKNDKHFIQITKEQYDFLKEALL